jgi:chromosome condensin MukBEF complex kleisin-like MukF subunit
MSDSKKSLTDIKASIEQLRDEIKLKAHLGGQETKDELEQLEKKWQTFISEYKPLITEAEKTAKNTSTALGLAADELKAGYDRIRKFF